MQSNQNDGDLDKVASIMEQIESYRRQECQSRKIGLTTLYNEMLESKTQPYLRQLHQELDEAVADLYGFPKEDLADEEKIISFLMDLNHQKKKMES